MPLLAVAARHYSTLNFAGSGLASVHLDIPPGAAQSYPALVSGGFTGGQSAAQRAMKYLSKMDARLSSGAFTSA